MDRPFSEASAAELEQIFVKHKHDRVVLAQLREELGFRHTRKAKQLLKEILGVLEGNVVLPPRPVRPAKPEDQIDLLPEPQRKRSR